MWVQWNIDLAGLENAQDGGNRGGIVFQQQPDGFFFLLRDANTARATRLAAWLSFL